MAKSIRVIRDLAIPLLACTATFNFKNFADLTKKVFTTTVCSCDNWIKKNKKRNLTTNYVYIDSLASTHLIRCLHFFAYAFSTRKVGSNFGMVQLHF